MRACLPYQLSSFPTSQEARLYTAKNVTFLFCFVLFWYPHSTYASFVSLRVRVCANIPPKKYLCFEFPPIAPTPTSPTQRGVYIFMFCFSFVRCKNVYCFISFAEWIDDLNVFAPVTFCSVCKLTTGTLAMMISLWTSGALEQIHSKTLWHLTFTISIRGRKTKKCRLVKMKRNEEQLSFHFWCRLHIPDQMNHRRIEYTCRHPDDSRRLGFRVSLPKGGVLNEEGLSRRVAEEMFSNKSRDNVMKWRGEKQERAIHTLRVSMMLCWRTRNLWRLLCLVSKSLTFSGFKFRSRHRAHTRSSELKEIYGRVKRIKRK